MSAEVTRSVPVLLPSLSKVSTVLVSKAEVGSVTMAVKLSWLRASASLAAIQAKQARTMLTQTMKTAYITPPRQPDLYSRLCLTGR